MMYIYHRLRSSAFTQLSSAEFYHDVNDADRKIAFFNMYYYRVFV